MIHLDRTCGHCGDSTTRRGSKRRSRDATPSRTAPGINREIGAATYQAVHVDGTRNVLTAAGRAGVRRLALVSFVRARPGTGSPYHDSKWEAEEIVRSSSLEWTVLKPGMMYGRGDHMLDHLSTALMTFPIYVGIGNRRVRPLAIDDAVRVLEASLADGRLPNKTVALLGPTELSFDEVARRVAHVMGKRHLFLRAPIAFHYLLARISEFVMTCRSSRGRRCGCWRRSSWRRRTRRTSYRRTSHHGSLSTTTRSGRGSRRGRSGSAARTCCGRDGIAPSSDSTAHARA